MIPFVELNTQFKGIESDIRSAIDRVFESGWFVLGKELEAFEREFAEFLGVGHAVGVGSGTDAIQLGLMACGVARGDEVITVANTCVPTAAAIVASGATPVLVDADPVTLTMDSTLVEAAITDRTRAIVPVHLYGHPCDMGPLVALAKSRGVPIVEDCAQAHGAKYKDIPVGGIGEAGAFSFYPSKNLGAYGDAGAVVTNDEAIAERSRKFRNYGEDERYHHSSHGINSRLDEIQAAVLRVKLGNLNEWNAARRRLADAYRSGLDGLPITLPTEADWAGHCYHLFVIRTPKRDALRAHLAAQDIGTQLHYPVPLHLQEAFAWLDRPRGSFPVAEAAADEVLSLPMYPELSEDSVREVCRAVSDFFE